MSDNSFIPNLIVLKNSSQSVLHYICTRDGIFERNKLYGCRKYKIADKKFSINSDTGVSVSLAPKAAIWGDMIFILRISWTYLWRWEQCAIFSDGNKLSKVPVSSQQQMAVPLCIIVTNLSQNYCFKQTKKKLWVNTARHNSQEDERMRDHKSSQKTELFITDNAVRPMMINEKYL